MAIDRELVDQLLAGRDPKDVFSKDVLLEDLKKALSERILAAELASISKGRLWRLAATGATARQGRRC